MIIKAMDLKANASNNTVYADSEGNIALTGMVTLFLKEIKAKLVESG
jgi:hypothetical protein